MSVQQHAEMTQYLIVYNNTFVASAIAGSRMPNASISAHSVLLPIFAIISIILLIVPFRFHWRARNTGAWALILVLLIDNIITFTNVLIWPSADFANWFNGHILCDIEVRLLAPLNIAYNASLMCIVRSLARVLDVERPDLNPTKGQRRRRLIVDLLICFGIPVVTIGTMYIAQSYRYLIAAVTGCRDVYDASWPTIVLILMWPIIFSLGTLYYTSKPLTITHFLPFTKDQPLTPPSRRPNPPLPPPPLHLLHPLLPIPLLRALPPPLPPLPLQPAHLPPLVNILLLLQPQARQMVSLQLAHHPQPGHLGRSHLPRHAGAVYY